MKKTTASKKTVYEVITDRIIDRLEQCLETGEQIPWRMPWKAGTQWPTNLVSKKPYQGANVMLLAMQRYASPFWLTYRQASELGGQVRKGEQSTPIVFWSFVDKDDPETGEVKRQPILRYYSVFNVAQVDNLDPAKIPTVETRALEETETAALAAGIVAGYTDRPEIRYGHSQACFIPTLDRVEMPDRNTFVDDCSFFSVLFHELTHSTARENRLSRRPSTVKRHYGDAAYSAEELCAELGACYLCSEAGLIMATIENSTAYIQSWLKALKNDSRLLLTAAGHAQKAADYILGRRPAPSAGLEEAGDAC
jgi:antirestriction protein ArdC